MDYKQQQEFRKRFRKRAEQEFSEQIKNFNDAQKKKFFDGVDALIAPQLEEMQATQRRIKQRKEDIHFFSFGIVVAIIGGCVANILHDTLKEQGLWYVIPAIGLFILTLFTVRQYFTYKENDDYENDPMWGVLIKEARRLKQESKNKKNAK